MGIKLRDLSSPKKIKINDLDGNVVAIDGFNTIYQFLTTIRGQSGEPLMDSKGRVTSHLTGLFYRNINLLMANIKPIYVLDGKPSPLKKIIIERRKEIKEKMKEKYHQALKEGKIEDAKKYARSTVKINELIINDCKKILELMGIPVIDAPSEGEAAAAYLTEINFASVTASQDYDSLLFGAKKLVRNLNTTGKRRIQNTNKYINVEPEMIELNEFLNENKINRNQLIDMGILIGTDFNPDGFTNIGPKTALKLIRKYERIEDIPNIKIELERIDINEIRKIFLEPHSIKTDNIIHKKIEKEKLISFLCQDRDFSQQRVKNRLNELEKMETNRAQSLDKWFS
jgi:flap endonuclease-1|tara:strand:+ start:60 stop:1085 length:1026 start_codon:yes stop_codon:yes gene_type:complete